MNSFTKNIIENIDKKIKSSKITLLSWTSINDVDDGRNMTSEPYQKSLLPDARAKIMAHDLQF
jgi:hypothetical protein